MCSDFPSDSLHQETNAMDDRSFQGQSTYASREWWVKPAIIGGLFISAILVFFIFFSFKSVQAYEGCLLVRNGEVKEEWEPGFHWRFRIMSNVTCYRTARTTYEAIPEGTGSDADYIDSSVDSRSIDGQRIDAISYRVAFHVPLTLIDDQGNVLVQDNLETVYTAVGARTEQQIVNSIVTFYTRPTVRSTFQLYTSDQILGGKIEEIEKAIEDQVRGDFFKRGVILEDIELGKPDFNDEFEAKIQAEQNARQDVETAKQAVAKAEQDALAITAAAKGEANAAIEAAKGEAQSNIARANGQAEATIALAKGDAEATNIKAEANANAVAAQVAAYGGPDAYVQALMAQALANWRPINIIGDTNGGVLSILDLGGEPTPTAAPTPEPQS